METRFTIYCGLKVGKDDSPCTISKSRALVYEFAGRDLKAFTAIEAMGFWRSEAEPTIVITFITDSRAGIASVNSFAHAYKWNNNQELVMITEEEISCRLY